MSILRLPFLAGIVTLTAMLIISCKTETDSPTEAETGNHVTARWQTITIDHAYEAYSERGANNPFTDVRADVLFTHADTHMTVPAYFAADGNAAETSADSGRIWRVKFNPPLEGEWTYAFHFRAGQDAVYAPFDSASVKVPGAELHRGKVSVGPPLPGERGRLKRTHPRYLQFQESGEYLLKAGAGSPENLLAFADFDGTYRHDDAFRDGESKTAGLHAYADHVAHAPADAPTWQNGKGKGLFGALQYLRDQGANSIYFLTMNIGGDGKDVWPYVDHETLDRFDVSKLAQWERVFQFADDLGMHLHFVLQETENESLLDGGNTGQLRGLYYRELIARYGHHRALTWDLGEENGPNNWSDNPQSNDQQRAMAAYFTANDPYANHVVLHTHSEPKEAYGILQPLLGDTALGGIALQVSDPRKVHENTLRYVRESAAAGRPWIVSLDEVGPWWRGLDPDAGYSPQPDLNNQDSLRALVLWGNLMAGGAGVEWYFGAKSATNDLNTESFRPYQQAWNWSRATLDFFHNYVPFAKMYPGDDWVTGEATCLVGEDHYLVSLPFGRPTTLQIQIASGNYEMAWFDPANGDMQEWKMLGRYNGLELTPPSEKHWVTLIREK